MPAVRAKQVVRQAAARDPLVAKCVHLTIGALLARRDKAAALGAIHGVDLSDVVG
jgi:hypothetical protein